MLAYSLGLRHATTETDIAAIDNVTGNCCRMDSAGSRSASRWGIDCRGGGVTSCCTHNSVLTDKFAAYRQIGGILGTSASALFSSSSLSRI